MGTIGSRVSKISSSDNNINNSLSDNTNTVLSISNICMHVQICITLFNTSNFNAPQLETADQLVHLMY